MTRQRLFVSAHTHTLSMVGCMGADFGQAGFLDCQ